MPFSNFTLPINEISISVFFIICLVSYYFLFKDHHKRNELKFHEIYPLVINYLILCIISFLVLAFGIDRVFTGYVYNDEIYEVIKEFVTGFAIISVVIINFIFYVKKHRVDLTNEEQEAREENDKRDLKIAEVIELVILSLMFILPIFNIFKYINYIDKAEQIRQTLGGLLFMAISLFLLISLNPLNIKEKFKKLIKPKESKK